MTKLLKFMLVILINFLSFSLVSHILELLNLLWSPLYLIVLAFVMIPLLAWRAIANPAGRLAYIPAIILPTALFVMTLPEAISLGEFYLPALLSSMTGVLLNVCILKFGGRFIYNHK